MKNLYNLFFLSAIIFAGCEIKVPVDFQKSTQTQSTISKEAEGVRNSLREVSKDDCLKVYKLFKGFSNYLGVTKNTKNTTQAMLKFKAVREDFGWTDNAYPALTDFTKDNILSQPFIKKLNDGIAPEEFTSTVAANWSKLYSEYAEGARLAYLDKKDVRPN